MPAWMNTVIGGAVLAMLTGSAGYLGHELRTFRTDFEVLKESQRNQLKSAIVRIYDEARERGFITAAALDTLNRLAESYWKLGGNSYIKAVVAHANAMEVRGTLPGD